MVRFGTRWLVGSGLLFAAAPDAYAQLLYAENGVEVRASVRIVEYGAETCRVLEEHESAASYRRKRGNEGQPIDIWQVDYSVYNGSGRPLDRLLAVYRAEAHELPCTTWGLPSRTHLPGRVRLKSEDGLIERDSETPMAPGETLTATSYMYVFRGHEAWLAQWSANYEIAAAPAALPEVRPAVTSAGPPERATPAEPPGPSAAEAAFVPPDIPPVDPAKVFSDCAGLSADGDRAGRNLRDGLSGVGEGPA